MVVIYKNKILVIHKQNDILPLVTTWMEPEGITVSEISQTERQILYGFIYMWNVKNKINEQTKQKEAHRHREQTYGSQREGYLGDWVKKVKQLRSTNW